MNISTSVLALIDLLKEFKDEELKILGTAVNKELVKRDEEIKKVH